MPSVSVSLSATIAGQSFSGIVTRSGETPVETTVVVPAAKTASLTTRTDNDTGTFTAQAGHGLVTSDVVDVYWAGGLHTGMVATVSGNSVVLDAGSGDNLPTQGTAVTLSKVQTVQQTFDGTLAKQLLIAMSKEGSCRFTSGLLSAHLQGGEAYFWASSLGITNPISGSVASILMSNGDATTVNTIKVGVLLDTVPAL